ncbi:MAG: signal peptidase I [Candidatus Saccharimonadales bacterium]
MLTIERRQNLRDIMGIVWFVIAVIVGAWLINALVFRSFSVTGPSMESTMYTGDRLIVNRIPVAISALQGKPFSPSRGHVVVFRNPLFSQMKADEFIVKRVIGIPGDRVLIAGGHLTVFNASHPEGIDPYAGLGIAQSSVTGQSDEMVPEGQVFVVGDNRGGNESLDSRNGLGLIPLDNIVGPVAVRIYPFDKISTNF